MSFSHKYAGKLINIYWCCLKDWISILVSIELDAENRKIRVDKVDYIMDTW